MHTRELIAELQKKLDTVQYKYDIKFETEYKDYNYFELKSVVNVECAYKRDGTKMNLFFGKQMSVHEVPYILQNFNRWVRDLLFTIEQHELEEWLLIGGERVFDPHRK